MKIFFAEPQVFDKYSSCMEHQKDFENRGKSLLVVVPTAPTENYKKFTDAVREYNTMEPFNFETPTFLINRNYQKVTK